MTTAAPVCRAARMAVVALLLPVNTNWLSSAVWAAAKPAEVKLAGHETGIRDLAFSPNGRLLVSLGADGRVKLWDATTRKLIKTLLVLEQSPCVAVAIAADGRTVAAASHAGVQVWNAATGETRFPEVQLPGWTEALAFSPDGKFLVAAGGAYERDVPRLLVSDVATLASARPLSGHKADIGAVAFSPDGKLLASADEEGTLILWDTQTWTPATALETELEPGILKQPIRLAFSPDGKWLASSGGRNQVLVIDPLAGKVVGEFTGHEQCISALAFTPDGQQVASADFNLSLWTVAEGEVTQQFANPLGGRIEALAIHPSGQFIAWADAGTEIYLNRLTGVGPRPVSEPPIQPPPEPTTATADPDPPPETATGPAEPALRFWSDRSGRFRVKAVLVKIDGDQVTLRREDGKVVTLQATLLSDEDQQYLDTQR